MRFYCNRFLLTFVSIFSVSIIRSQTITINESRCINTGSVIFSGTVGAGGPYEILVAAYPADYTAPPPHILQSLPDTFAALFPGTYDFIIKDRNNTPFSYNGIIVPGNYIKPGNNDYSPVSSSVTNCAVFNGTISGTMHNGRSPYSYTILQGPAQQGTTNASGTFLNMPPGDYLLQAADSCQNIQTRSVRVSDQSTRDSFVITNAFLHLERCTFFSLDSLTVYPMFPPAGHYEVINDDGNGTTVTRASGTSLPVSFTLFNNRDIPNGRLIIKVFDSCGNVASYTPFRYRGYVADSIIAGVINRRGCNSFSLEALTVTPPIQPGATVQVTNTATGSVFSSTLPVFFTASVLQVTSGNILIKVTDSCGGIDSSNKIRIINNYWNFNPAVRIYCGVVVIDSLSFSGYVIQPYTVTVKALFRNSSGTADSTISQTVTSFPYTISGIPPDANPLTIRIEVTDSCGESRRVTLTQSYLLSAGSLRTKNCTLSTISLFPSGKFVLPVTYTPFPDPGVGSNTTGVFDLPPGTYTFTATDSCGRKAGFGPYTIDRNWQLQAVKQIRLCNPAYIQHYINIPVKSTGALTVKQYSGGMPVTAASVLLGTKIFQSINNGCAGCGATDTTNERVYFDSTLQGRTYSYIVTDTCGNSDTVSVVNDNVSPFYHFAFAKTRCVQGSDIYAGWRSEGNAANVVGVTILDANNQIVTALNTQGLTNLNNFPGGQIVMNNIPQGTYLVRYSFQNCPSYFFFDTVVAKDYVQPKVTAAQSFASCNGNGIPVVISGADGVTPYQYEVIDSYPDHLTLGAQGNPVFTMPSSQSTITVRITDACLNSSTRTVAITRVTGPSIRTNPPLLSTCTFPFNIRLYTDSIFAGSVFEWTKTTGAGAGAAVISRRPFLDIVYNSITDTATYKVRVTIPGSCFDESSFYDLNNVRLSCAAGISGNIFNDANGLTDGIVNGVGTNAGGLNVALVNASNIVVAVSPVSVSGTYGIPDIAPGNYSVVLTRLPVTVNAAAPAAVLPAGWVNTGEYAGTLPGNDGAANGKLVNVTVSALSLSNLNFGINRLPVANDTSEYRINPGGSGRVQVPVLTGSDAEDGIYDGVSGINTIIIQSLPGNATLYYNGSPVTAGQVISNYNPSLLTIDPLDNIATSQFTFSVTDAASMASVPDTVIIFFFGLPVTIVDLTATVSGDNVIISWLTAEQNGISVYAIEHSPDGYNFKAVGAVPASNLSSYKFIHTEPQNGVNYYRLKITAADGTITYSKTVTARMRMKTAITVYPNPFRNYIDIKMDIREKAAVEIILNDAQGRLICERNFTAIAGSNICKLNCPSSLSYGVYIVSIIVDGRITRTKLIRK